MRLLLPVAAWARHALITLLLIAGSLSYSHADTLTLRAGDQTRSYTPGDLSSPTSRTLDTEPPWTEGSGRYRGLPLQTLIEESGLRGGQARLRALNDYVVTVPVAELLNADAFIAAQRNGEPLKRRDKGPFWLIFPWSSRPELQAREVLSWSVWQLKEIEFVD